MMDSLVPAAERAIDLAPSRGDLEIDRTFFHYWT
jgi:hypothetical protein